MASTTWPDGSPKSVDDIEFEVLGAAWGVDGIIGTPTDTTVVFGDSSGRQIKIRSGKHGHVHGRGWASGATDIVKTIAANATGQPRIDLVVLGLDRATWLVTEYVLTGTAAASPSPPALTRTAMGGGTGKWEIPLARVAVAAGASTISAADVTPVHPWVGTTQEHVFANVAAMTAWPAVQGMRASVGGTNYQYQASAWRRENWASPWGVIGGKLWAADGVLVAQGIFDEGFANLDSGAVALTAGRRYRIQHLFVSTRDGGPEGCYFRIRDTNVAGAIRGELFEPMELNQWGYTFVITGFYDCVADESKTFVLVAAARYPGKTTGLVNVYRASAQRSFFQVEDIGPTAALTFV